MIVIIIITMIVIIIMIIIIQCTIRNKILNVLQVNIIFPQVSCPLISGQSCVATLLNAKQKTNTSLFMNNIHPTLPATAPPHHTTQGRDAAPQRSKCNNTANN